MHFIWIKKKSKAKHIFVNFSMLPLQAVCTDTAVSFCHAVFAISETCVPGNLDTNMKLYQVFQQMLQNKIYIDILCEVT